jgi:hypothetical protein
MGDVINIGCWAAFWGDTKSAVAQLLRVPELDYLVSDYLAEITLALLARQRAKDPNAGYTPDAIAALAPHLEQIHERGIKIVTNAGALNAPACAEAFAAAADEAGVPLTVATVEGDDLLPQRDRHLASGAEDMFTGRPVPEALSSMNAYLGARPIATALGAGADVVVTGRCADAAVILGPLLHEFSWSDDDPDLLAAGYLAGHIVECGPQCTGGTFTDWATVPGWDDMGYPIVECHRDGTAVITKPPGTGGLVTPATVGEQILYEIGDPGAYVLPDVVCDWRAVQLEQVGPDRVRVSGARGHPPTTRYKVTATHQNGYRAMTSAMFAGYEAAGRARRAGEALVQRSRRLIAGAGFGDFDEVLIEVVGAGDVLGASSAPDAATEVVLKVGVRHAERGALEIFAGELAPTGLVAQGMTGIFAGRPRPAPAIEIYHLLVDKADVPVRVRIDEETIPVEVAVGEDRDVSTPALAEDGATGPDGTGSAANGYVRVPLRRLAYGRSGDKGNLANIGLIARRPEFLDSIREQVTANRVASFFGHLLRGEVRRWDVPGMNAINITLDQVLGGMGGTSTLRYDPQGKSYAAMLLTMPIAVPAEWDHDGLLTPAAG